jgi:hypothetical protein
MSKKPEFTKIGSKARRPSMKAVDELGIPSPDEVLQALRSKPARGTPSRTENALPARKVLRLNQRGFARSIGTSPAAIRNWNKAVHAFLVWPRSSCV